MKMVTVAELRDNIDSLLEEVLVMGIPLEVNKGGRMLRITPVEDADKLQNLVQRPNVIVGDPQDLVDYKV